jgi:hypothetical protein
VRRVPKKHRWVFWDVDAAKLDVKGDADYIIPRVLEHGGWDEVCWLIDVCGFKRIHRFLRDVGHPELSPRTIAFWRALFKAEDEPWKGPPAWRRNSSAPWPG